MEFFIAKKFPNSSFSEMDAKVRAELKKEGFGVITEIDLKKTFKEKIDVDFRNYTIIGACNPSFAYKALQAESRIGTMLPCNVIVQETEDGQIEVSAIDPIASMQTIENPELAEIADQVQAKLKKVVENL